MGIEKETKSEEKETKSEEKETKSQESQVEEVTMEDIKGIVAQCMKDNGYSKDVMEELKKEMKEVNEKAVFKGEQDPDTGERETHSKSVINYNALYKNWHGPRSGDARKDGIDLFSKMQTTGNGIWLELSDDMKKFGAIALAKAKSVSLDTLDFDYKEYNEKQKELYKQAGMNEGALADGGALVPVEFLATVIEFATQQSQILNKVWRLPMTTNIMRISKLSQAAGNYFGGITFYSPGEGVEKTSTKPTLERLEFDAKKRIGLVHLTDELIGDSMINVLNYITALFTRGMQYDMEGLIISNAAAAAPCTGIIQDPAVNIVARQTAGTVGYQDMVNLDSAIDENIQDLSWITRKATKNTLATLRDTNNHPIFYNGYNTFTNEKMATPEMTGYPVHLTRNVPSMGTQGDIILGDLSWYILAMRQDLQVDMSNAPRFEYDETTIRFVSRYDGMPAISEAFAILGDAES